LGLKAILAELLRPGGNATPYERGVVGIAHAMLGAALIGPFGSYGLGAALILGAAYWLAKEWRDLQRGGALLDGLEDAVMVMLGAWYGAAWWPALMVACGAYLMVMGARR
jgi:hypothetical protein